MDVASSQGSFRGRCGEEPSVSQCFLRRLAHNLVFCLQNARGKKNVCYCQPPIRGTLPGQSGGLFLGPSVPGLTLAIPSVLDYCLLVSCGIVFSISWLEAALGLSLPFAPDPLDLVRQPKMDTSKKEEIHCGIIQTQPTLSTNTDR